MPYGELRLMSNSFGSAFWQLSPSSLDSKSCCAGDLVYSLLQIPNGRGLCQIGRRRNRFADGAPDAPYRNVLGYAVLVTRDFVIDVNFVKPFIDILNITRNQLEFCAYRVFMVWE